MENYNNDRFKTRVEAGKAGSFFGQPDDPLATQRQLRDILRIIKIAYGLRDL